MNQTDSDDSDDDTTCTCAEHGTTCTVAMLPELAELKRGDVVIVEDSEPPTPPPPSRISRRSSKIQAKIRPPQMARHRIMLRDNLQGITNPAIRRIAHRSGVKRISGHVYEDARAALKTFLEGLIRDTTSYTEYARRKTVTSMDVIYALKSQNLSLYGFSI